MPAHGSNLAAWTAVGVALVGFVLAGAALIAGPHWVVFFVGLGLLPLAAIVGKVMSVAGMGASRR